jgi:hypothetical protein
MSSLDTFSLSSILCVGVITTIIFAVSKWSNAADSKAEKNVCASCGIAGGDDVKLEECTDCQSARYCSDKCREEHREQHGEECKISVEALHDRKIFAEPESTHDGECPICFLPLPLDPSKSTFYSCCSKVICNGCIYANRKSKGNQLCPFCREPCPSEEENYKRLMKRVKANDPVALRHMGGKCFHVGDDEGAALEYWTKAADLGDLGAHYDLGVMYKKGEGVEEDEEKSMRHWETAAIGGHPIARHALALCEEDNGNMERAVKHYIIAANLGYEKSMKELWKYYSDGNITKQDLEVTLRSHQAALDAMKSPQRDAAEAEAAL